jgi:galactoside O-acetyltransferase
MRWFIEKLCQEMIGWVDQSLAYLPGRVGILTRALVIRRRVKRAGRHLLVGTGVEITGHANIEMGNNVQLMKRSSLYAHEGGRMTIGDDFFLNANSAISASEGGEIVIGDDVMIGPNVVVRASEHEFADEHTQISRQGHRVGKVIIGNDCWICANVVITGGVTIGSHSIIAAGAVVTHDVEPYSVMAGVPAKLIARRGGPEQTTPTPGCDPKRR